MLSIALLFVHAGTVCSLRLNPSTEQSTSTCISNVIITRTAHPMPGMIDRMHQFSSDLKRNSQFKFVALVDETHRKEALTLSVPQDEIPVYHYTTDDLVNAFPIWKKAFSMWGNATRTHPPNNYYFHMESIFLAVDFIEKSNTNTCDNAKYWVFEDDVFLCGSILNLIQYYDEKPPYSDADLLDHVSHTHATKKNPYRSWGSDEYNKRYPHNLRHFASEHVMRFSKRLLTHMRNLVEQGITAESEWFAPTVADYDGFKRKEFSLEHLGMYSFNQRLTKKAADCLCNTETFQGRLTINHAGKFTKEQFSWAMSQGRVIASNETEKQDSDADELRLAIQSENFGSQRPGQISKDVMECVTR